MQYIIGRLSTVALYRPTGVVDSEMKFVFPKKSVRIKL